MADDVVRFCRSRSAGRRCTRPLDHAGLHRHRTIMWSDAGADASRCSRSGEPAVPARELSDGFPHGRALCAGCLSFVPLVDGMLVEHHADAPDDDPTARAAWFNAYGW